MKKRIKKGLAGLALFLAFSLCACGSGPAAGNSVGTGSGTRGESGAAGSKTGGEDGAAAATGNETAAGSVSDGAGETASGGGTGGSGDLRNLWEAKLDSACYTGDGYYYLTGEVQELPDGNYGSHLMYMDFATGKEVYLCSTSGCKHDSADCTSVYLYDDFPIYTTKLFVYQGCLYILSRDADQDGSMSMSVVGEDAQPEARPAVLYRANLDGTERKKVYGFDPELTLEDMGAADDGGIYVITKKVSTDNENGASYSVSAERKLQYLDLESGSLREVCPMDFGDHISWTAVGCYGRALVLGGTDYGRELSREEIWADDDASKELFENSFDVYATLQVDSGELKEIYRTSNKEEHSVQPLGGRLYVSAAADGKIEAIDMKTGEKETLCSLPQSCIMETLGDVLCCRDWDLTADHTWYFVDTESGKVSHCTLVNQCNGWELELRGDAGEEALVVYDYDAVGNADGSYEINQYKYALIPKEDLFAGKENYRRIEMVGAGK